ncbi:MULTISPECIES: hypothetical protein [unclassified Chryseobacterium]|uniref:hypothetical protein n=1 Tax=unclassified Chryseobacterium TaxID=2593645 RepID=UPI00100ADD71|nr:MULTISPECIES: hypothetical protein [unclassified Chryseobacterium]RXM53401.1 hypothetical protein BOQ64_03305 [Chryseobacterium sp. CH25]RXM65396.1 hypothetical protein BOQ60_06180 [Chryseobacterium sp. CH1]
MKIIITLTLIASSLLSAQIKVPDDYKKIPDILDTTEYLYPFIIPNKEYAYWRVLTNDPDPDKAIIYESQAPDFMTINEPVPEKGFFQKCIGDHCFSYILACKKERPVYFSNEQQLRDFIGTVDNLPEAILLAKTYGYSIDTQNRFTGSYKIEDQSIAMYVLQAKGCPLTKESFLIKINRKTGKLEAKSNGIFSKSEDCTTL